MPEPYTLSEGELRLASSLTNKLQQARATAYQARQQLDAAEKDVAIAEKEFAGALVALGEAHGIAAPIDINITPAGAVISTSRKQP